MRGKGNSIGTTIEEVTRMENPSVEKVKGAVAKRPYRKPEVRFEKVFEVMALVCGKVHHTQLSCRSSRKAS